MVIDINRATIGALILTFFIFNYFFQFDYLVLIILSMLVIYDLNKSNFLNNFYDYVFLIIFLLTLPIIYFNYKVIVFFNFLVILSSVVILFKPNFYGKKIFLFVILIFIQNFFAVLLNSREVFYFIFFIAFFNDTIAYIFGKSIKGPLIIPNISPKKTWSGTTLSFILTSIIIFLFDYPLILSILLSLSLFLGDIFFSFIKRNYNLKDFSNILGGHGGILDRLDSMFIFIIIMNFYIWNSYLKFVL